MTEEWKFRDNPELEEWTARKLKQAEAADGRPIYGKKSSAVRFSDRIYKAYESQPDNIGRKPAPITKTVQWDVPDVKKRTPRARAEAMSSRLWEAAMKNPADRAMLFQKIQGELWQQGKPCSYEDVRRVAGELIEQAEKDEAEKYRKMVSH